MATRTDLIATTETMVLASFQSEPDVWRIKKRPGAGRGLWADRLGGQAMEKLRVYASPAYCSFTLRGIGEAHQFFQRREAQLYDAIRAVELYQQISRSQLLREAVRSRLTGLASDVGAGKRAMDLSTKEPPS